MQATQPLVQRSEMRPATAAITDWLPKCAACNRTLGGFFTRPWSLKCRKCHALNDSASYRIALTPLDTRNLTRIE